MCEPTQSRLHRWHPARSSLGLVMRLLPWRNPMFEMKASFVGVNNSREPVFVVAKWRNDAKQIGNIGAMSSFEFSLDAEAAIQFRVSYPDGATAESKPIYFTRGTKVIATITSDGVTVGYDHEN